ncbi:hypothetical protein M9Y10_039966 [Tritrichomonas musculus]|uniref:KilA-N domain-containing protein n=1 Tax=Tritrichomonas musculus TaxID=1915356 RepID=A0ABR2GQD3_9EUKA
MNSTIVTSINDEYEYLQYNEQLRIIHSISDDMFQIKSIIDSCHSNKRVNDWFRNQSTQEILNEMTSTGFPALEKLYEKRDDLPIELRGYYVHRLLVNQIAMWASPRYSIHIMKLLDSYFERQRNQLKEQIENLTLRAVPEGRQFDYVFFIWRESISNSITRCKLHLVRRHIDSFSKMRNHFDNPDENWFYRDHLPVSMTCNRDIKNLIRENFNENEMLIDNCVIYAQIDLLEQLYDLITLYFTEFQE